MFVILLAISLCLNSARSLFLYTLIQFIKIGFWSCQYSFAHNCMHAICFPISHEKRLCYFIYLFSTNTHTCTHTHTHTHTQILAHIYMHVPKQKHTWHVPFCDSSLLYSSFRKKRTWKNIINKIYNHCIYNIF